MKTKRIVALILVSLMLSMLSISLAADNHTGIATDTTIDVANIEVVDYALPQVDNFEYQLVATTDTVLGVARGNTDKQVTKTLTYNIEMSGTFLGYHYVYVTGLYSTADNTSQILSVTDSTTVAGSTMKKYINGNSALIELYFGVKLARTIYCTIATNGNISTIEQ